VRREDWFGFIVGFFVCMWLMGACGVALGLALR
jgi:hypothetical protein